MKKLKYLIFLMGLMIALSANPVEVEASTYVKPMTITLAKKTTPTPKPNKKKTTPTPTPKTNKKKKENIPTTVTTTKKESNPVKSAGISLLLGGLSAGGCVLMHKKKTSGIGKRVENLEWDRDGVKVVGTKYIRTYKTVKKDVYNRDK